MLCALPVFKDDIPKLLNLIKWIDQLGGCKDHDAVIVADAATPAGLTFEVQEKAAQCFKSVEIATTEKAINGWPEGPNELFLRAARHAKAVGCHWLFLEPDCVPLCPGWLDKIDIHYRVKGARYLGQIVPCNEPRGTLPPRHFTGVGVYPANAILNVEWPVLQNPRMAFDISTAGVVVPQATHCELFQHLWGEVGNPPTFAEKAVPGTNTFGLDYLRSDAVLFHRTKDGKLIDLLRKRAGLVDYPQVEKPFIQLGRFGDIILLLPALRYLYRCTGKKPRLIVAKDYASVLEGVSYVEPIPLPIHWYMGMPKAREYAQQHFGGATVLQCYGHNWGVNLKKWPNFMVSMIDRTGVPLDLFYQLPLVFDLRHPGREASVIPKLNRPYILINTVGVSSPFPHGPKIHSVLRHLQDRVALIDMSKIRCHRIYDLLGPMDHAVGLITTDTATLHLAHGCKQPYIALTVDGWCSSTPRGRCDLEVKYSQFMANLSRIVGTVESWL
jgi:hypothetical protein